MNKLQIALKENEINGLEVRETVADVFSSIFLSGNIDADELSEMDAFVESMSTLINRAIRKTSAESKTHKLKLIRVAEKLSNLKDSLDLKTGRLTQETIQNAGKHLGRKAQSAFEG